MYKKLLNVVEQRIVVEDTVKRSKAKWEENNAVKLAQLADLKEKEILLREEAILSLEKEEKDSVEIEDKIIIKQTRITKTIDDARVIKKSIEEKIGDLEELGITPDIEELFTEEIIVMDKKKVLDIMDSYNKLTGEDLEGVLIKSTKFITVKNK